MACVLEARAKQLQQQLEASRFFAFNWFSPVDFIFHSIRLPAKLEQQIQRAKLDWLT